MSLEPGKVYSLIGSNGTGKTTLFNLITGFIKPDFGEIWLNKIRLDKLSPVRINSKGISRTFQDLRIINQLSVKENILLSFKNNPGEKILNSFLPPIFFRNHYDALLRKTNYLLNKVHLVEVENNLAGDISYGQQKLLTLGCCLANDPQLLLLDEPIAGIEKSNYIQIYDLILELKNEGRTILQIEHNHDFIAPLSDAIWFMHDGCVVHFENYDSFLTNSIVKEKYLH